MTKRGLNLTLMLAEDVTMSNLKDLIKDFDSRNIIYPKGAAKKLNQVPCIVYKRKGPSQKPEWSERLKKMGIDISEHLSDISSQGALLFIPVTKKSKNYMFILNYSTGHFSIKRSTLNKNFGIYIAQKELNENRAVIRRERSRGLATNPINIDRMLGHAIEDENFRLMLGTNEVIQEETIYANSNDLFYSSMIGSYNSLNISLNFNVDTNYITIDQLKNSFEKLIDIYDSFGEEDKIRLSNGILPISIETMEKEISNQLKNNPQNFFFFEPEMDINLAADYYFKIGNNRYNELDINEYRENHELTYETLKEEVVIIYNRAGEEEGEEEEEGRELKRWNLLDCLYGEFEYNGTVYFISQGKLYTMNKDRYEDINNNILSIQDNDFALSKQGIQSVNDNIQTNVNNERIQREYYYNKQLSKELNGELFDQANHHITIYETQIEVCDVFLPAERVFIHSKIQRGPDSLSHLFAQGKVSADAYAQTTSRFVTRVNERISDHSRHINEDWHGATIRYVILTRNQNNKLPFFAKMNLNSIINHLKSQGFHVKLSWERRVNLN